MRRSAIVSGIKMSWTEVGEGLPVVLVHGIPTSPELWRKVIPLLYGVRSLAWEMVGYGHSIAEGRDRDISVAGQAKYLTAWMHHLEIVKAVLVGHDLGGGVIQIAAVRHPELCRGLFLTNSIGYDSWPIPSVMALKASASLMKHLPRPLFKLLVMSLLYRGHQSRSEAMEAYRLHIAPYLAQDGAGALIRQISDLRTQDTLAVAADLPQLGVPARIAWGEDDQFQKIEFGERFARDLSAPLRRIPHGKHFTPEDHPAIIAEEIMKLVEETSGGRTSGRKPPRSVSKQTGSSDG